MRVARLLLAVFLACWGALAGAGVAVAAEAPPWMPPSLGALASELADGIYHGGAAVEVEVPPQSVGTYTACAIIPGPGYWDAANSRYIVGYAPDCKEGVTPPVPSTTSLFASVTSSIRWTCDGVSASSPAQFQYLTDGQGITLAVKTARCADGVYQFERYESFTNGAGTYWYPLVVVRFNPAATLSVTCASSSGVTFRTVTGFGALSVGCPSGSSPVAGSVGDQAFEVPGYSSTPGLAAACMAGECSPRITMGGYSCDPTMALSGIQWCDRAGSTGQMPAAAACEWHHPTLGVIALQSADCASWLEGIAGEAPPAPEDPDTNIVTEWLIRIKGAIDAVRGVIDVTRQAIVGILEDILEGITGGGGEGSGTSGMSVCGREPVTNWLNPAEWVYDSLECAFVPSEGFMESYSAGFTAGLSSEWMGEWSPDNPDGPVFGIVDALFGLTAGCYCSGWQFELGGHQYEILSSCFDGPVKTLKQYGQAFSGAAVLVGGVVTCVSLVTSALGLPWFRNEVKTANTPEPAGPEWDTYDPSLRSGRYADSEGKTLR